MKAKAKAPRARATAKKTTMATPARGSALGAGYAQFLATVKDRVRAAQLKAALAANSELVLLYWDLGSEILRREKDEGWGAKVVELLARDLKAEFPDMQGFSPRNLRYMKDFAAAWPAGQILQQLVAKLPWGHHTVLLTKVEHQDQRLFYVRSAIENGWSRSVLSLHIERQLHRRKGAATTNFKRTLPAPQSDLAEQALKDPYVFDFLTLRADAHEREVENALVEHVRDFLLELGVGFAFVGNQVRLDVGEQEFFVDLLFYHLRLSCFVVVELKNTAFKPEYAGQLNFYLSAVDSQLKRPADSPTIGLLLCKGRDRVVAEYALRDINKPIGVAQWQSQLVASLPKELQASLPTIEQLEAELVKEK